MEASLYCLIVGKTFYKSIHTVGEKKDSTKRYLWSKTTLITGGVGGAWVDPVS